MKTLFIILCDIMAAAAVVAAGALAVWVFAAMFRSPIAWPAAAVCIAAGIVAVIATVAAFIVWKNGGAPGSDDPPTEEGDE